MGALPSAVAGIHKDVVDELDKLRVRQGYCDLESSVRKIRRIPECLVGLNGWYAPDDLLGKRVSGA